MNGLLLVDKPVGPTSFDVIRELRRATKVRKIGHAGTLDPLASGLMLVLFGAACKSAGSLTKMDKRYLAHIRLGISSDTGDGEGVKTVISHRRPSQREVEDNLLKFTGELTQTPSVYSAVKIDGKEAYKRVRAGESVSVPARQIVVYENRLVSYDYPYLDLDTRVSSGTYIRTLAEDLGQALDTGAYLSGLTRIEVGTFLLKDAIALSQATLDKVGQELVECF